MKLGDAFGDFWEPIWSGGWDLFRWAWVLVVLGYHGPRVRWVEDAYAAVDMQIATDMLFPINLSPTAGYAMWGLGVLGAVLVAVGGKAIRPGLVCFLIGFTTFIAAEGINIKAYDRLLVLQAFILLFAPIGERVGADVMDRWRSPFARHLLVLQYGAMYLLAGFAKLDADPWAWVDGTALSYSLVHDDFGLQPIGVLVSGQAWLCQLLCWTTMVMQLFFWVLVLFRRTNLLALLLGFGFHLGLLLTMDVGPFSLIALSAYPVLLHPEIARSLYERVVRR